MAIPLFLAISLNFSARPIVSLTLPMPLSVKLASTMNVAIENAPSWPPAQPLQRKLTSVGITKSIVMTSKQPAPHAAHMGGHGPHGCTDFFSGSDVRYGSLADI